MLLLLEAIRYMALLVILLFVMYGSGRMFGLGMGVSLKNIATKSNLRRKAIETIGT